MKVNGNDVSQYGVQQWRLSPETSSISNESEWTDGAKLPTMLKSKVGFKKMKVDIMIRGSTRQEIWQKSSDFVASLLTPCEYQFDDFEHCFFAYLKNAEHVEQSLKRWHTATLELEGYEYGAQVINTSTAKNIAIINEGNLLTPAIVEITPLINLVDLTITGLVRDSITGEDIPIVVSNLTNGKAISIDGETGLITEDGANKFADVELWDLPTLLPGTNNITVNKDVSITIWHKPRYF